MVVKNGLQLTQISFVKSHDSWRILKRKEVVDSHESLLSWGDTALKKKTTDDLFVFDLFH